MLCECGAVGVCARGVFVTCCSTLNNGGMYCAYDSSVLDGDAPVGVSITGVSGKSSFWIFRGTVFSVFVASTGASCVTGWAEVMSALRYFPSARTG